MSQDQARWIYLAAGTLVLICAGSIYAFSVLSGPLAQLRGWVAPQVALGFTICTAISPVPMILGGKIVDKGWARAGMTAGLLLFGLGFVITGLSSSIDMYYLGYGLFGGMGIGLAYSGALGNMTRYFPDRRGLATGILMAGNGASALLTAPLANWLIGARGVVDAWLYLGIGFLVVATVCGLITRTAPNGYRPAGWEPGTASASQGRAHDFDWTEMLRQPVFYLLLFVLATGALSGLMVAANGSQIGQQMFGLTAGEAALYVGLYAAGSAGGRFLWGALSDKIGRANALTCIFILVALMLVVLAGFRMQIAFAIGFVGIGLSFGGLMGVFPPLVVERFGQAGFGVNYGIVFTGYSIAAFLGPRIGASIGARHQGDYTLAFLGALAVCVPGAIASIAFQRKFSPRSI